VWILHSLLLLSFNVVLNKEIIASTTNLFIFSSTQKFDSNEMLYFQLEARDDISVLPGQQWKVKLDEPSQPDTQDYEVEHFMNIDGEAFTIPKPEYQAK
jgi:hypothetical protein